MKYLILLILLLFVLTTKTYSQDNVKIYEYAIVYLEEFQLKKNKLIIYYGNGKEEDFEQKKGIKLEKRHFKNFNNIVDVLNYMSEQGYELVNTNTALLTDNVLMYQYILRREKY